MSFCTLDTSFSLCVIKALQFSENGIELAHGSLEGCQLLEDLSTCIMELRVGILKGT